MYVVLRAVATDQPATMSYEIWLASLLVFFIITLKVSALPLVVIPFVMLVIAYRHRLALALRGLGLVVFGTGALILGPWIARGVMLSGCLLYPVSATCLQALPWAVTRAQADTEARWIESWARWPNHTPEQVLGNWDWLKPWFYRLITTNDFILPLICLGIGLVLIAVTWRTTRLIPGRGGVVAVIGAMFVGMLYWFWTAPDLRFGSGWFWAIGLLVLSMGIWGLTKQERFTLPLRLGAVILLIAATLAVADVGVSYVQRAGWAYQQLLYAVPPVPTAQVTVQKTQQGVALTIANPPGDACWWSDPLCTPYFQPTLTIGRGALNRLVIYPVR